MVDFGKGYLGGDGPYRVVGAKADVAVQLRSDGDFVVEPTTLAASEKPINDYLPRR